MKNFIGYFLLGAIVAGLNQAIGGDLVSLILGVIVGMVKLDLDNV